MSSHTCTVTGILSSGTILEQKQVRRLGYGWNDWGIGVQSPAGERQFFFLHSVYTTSRVHPGNTSMGNEGKMTEG